MSPAAALILEMQIYPIIRNTIPRKAKPMGSEDYQELVQDTTATAAAMIDAMEKSSKKPIPSSITYYPESRIKRTLFGGNSQVLHEQLVPGH